MQVWQSLGIVDELDVLPVERTSGSAPTASTILRMDHPPLGPSGWEPGYSFFQPRLERALDRRVRALPTVEVHCGWSAEALEPFGDHVELTLRRVREPRVGELEPTDETPTVRARYVIGADGANSFVRDAAGIAFDDLGFAERWLVVDIRPARRRALGVDPRAVPVVRPGAAAHAHAQRPHAPALRVHAAARRAAGGLRRRGARVGAARAVVHAGRRRARAPRGLRVPRPAGGDDARRSRAAGRRRGAHDAAVHGAGPVLRRPRRREPRLAAGPRPARRGRRRAARRLHGRAPAAERVDREPVAPRWGACRAARSRRPPPSATPALRAAEAPPPLGAAAAAATARWPPAGRWPGPAPCRASSASAAARAASTTSSARASCCSRGAPPSSRRAHAELLERIGAHVVASTQLDDLDGRLTAWLDEHGAEAVLVRPDAYVFGAVEAPDDLPALVDDLRAQLSITDTRITADVR